MSANSIFPPGFKNIIEVTYIFWGESDAEETEGICDKDFEKSQLATLTVSGWRVALSLAYYGPTNMYQIAKIYGRGASAYSMVHHGTDELEELGWVKVIEERFSEKNVSTKVISLTQKGLLWIISRIPRNVLPERYLSLKDRFRFREKVEEDYLLENLRDQADIHLHLLYGFDLGKIAKANSCLFPLVLGKWDFFVKSKIEPHVNGDIVENAFSALVEYGYGWEGIRDKYGSLEEIFNYKVYRALMERMSRNYLDSESTEKKRIVAVASEIFKDKRLEEPLQHVCIEFDAQLKGRLAFFEKLAHSLGNPV